jgi:hypothetical protein
MFRFKIRVLTVLGCVWASACQAQFTNVLVPLPPATKLEALEANVGVVILKAATDLGTVAARTAMIGVSCRESTDASTGRKEQGLAIVLLHKTQPRDAMLIDAEEIPGLVAALRYLGALSPTVTPLNTVDAAFTTKGGFRIAALGSRITGGVQFGVRDVRNDAPPVLFSGNEMSALISLIEQGKATLDALRHG